MYLLDTNVISEVIKREPNKRALVWLNDVSIQDSYISVITIGEIRKGIEKLNDNLRKQKIQNWLEQELLDKFFGRIINIDYSIANKWGYITSIKNIPAIDALIAASALVHNYKLVTRNTKYFKEILGLEIINPWEI